MCDDDEVSIFTDLVEERFSDHFTYVGKGDHGEIFCNDDFTIKIMHVNNIEAELCYHLQKNAITPFQPEIISVGKIDNCTAIFRENLVDMDNTIFNQSLFHEFCIYCLDQEKLLYNVITEKEATTRKHNLLEKWGDRRTDMLDLRDLIEAHAHYWQRGIIVNDMRLHNIGLDKEGNVKFRDMSYWMTKDVLEKNVPEDDITDVIKAHIGMPSFRMD